MEWQVLAVLLLLCLAPPCRAANPHYQFSYGVADASTGDFKTQEETRVGGSVRGSYTLLEPGGTTRTVHYTADDEHGFNAVVQRHQAGAHGQVGVGAIVSPQHGTVAVNYQAAQQGLALAPYNQGVALPYQQLSYATHGVLPTASSRGFVAPASSYAAPVAASPGLLYAAPSYPSAGYATHRTHAPAAPLAFASAALGPSYSSVAHYAPALHGAYSAAPLAYAAPAVKSYAASAVPLGYASTAAAPATLGAYSSIPLAYASAAPAVKSYATAAPLGSYSSIPLAYASAAPAAVKTSYAAPVALSSSIPLARKTYPPPGPSLGSSVPLAYAAAPRQTHVAQVQTVLPTSYSFASFPAHYSASPVLLQARHPDSQQLLQLSSHR